MFIMRNNKQRTGGKIGCKIKQIINHIRYQFIKLEKLLPRIVGATI